MSDILENELRTLELEFAKLEDPWELISKPTVDHHPVGPDRKSFVLTITFLSL